MQKIRIIELPEGRAVYSGSLEDPNAILCFRLFRPAECMIPGYRSKICLFRLRKSDRQVRDKNLLNKAGKILCFMLCPPDKGSL